MLKLEIASLNFVAAIMIICLCGIGLALGQQVLGSLIYPSQIYPLSKIREIETHRLYTKYR